MISIQNPIRLNDYSGPEPDVALLKPRDDFYATGHLTVEDILVVIEVPKTSLEYNREVKIPRYAQAGGPEAWLLDLQHQAVIVYTHLKHTSYQVTHIVRGEEIVPSSILAGFSVRPADILWP